MPAQAILYSNHWIEHPPFEYWARELVPTYDAGHRKRAGFWGTIFAICGCCAAGRRKHWDWRQDSIAP